MSFHSKYLIIVSLFLLFATASCENKDKKADKQPVPTPTFGLVGDINKDKGISRILSGLGMNGVSYFYARDGAHGDELWRSDGTVEGTYLLKDIEPGINSSTGISEYFTRVGNSIYFAAQTRELGTELWKTDGTPQGTVPVKDLAPGKAGSNPSHLTAGSAGQLFFNADDGTGLKLWKKDGEAITPVLFDGTIATSPMATVGANTFFVATNAASGYELWKTDGNTTAMVKDINPLSGNSFPSSLTSIGDTLYFEADNGTDGREIWKSNGDETGTVQIVDINPTGTSDPQGFVAYNGLVFFTANNGSGVKLWHTNGVVGNAVIDESVQNLSFARSYPIVVNNLLFFAARDAEHGFELWKFDGVNYSIVKDINLGSVDSVLDSRMVATDNIFYFVAAETATATELWRSDGSADGTFILQDLAPGDAHMSPRFFTPAGDKLFFSGNIPRLFVTDGNKANTKLIDVQTDSTYSSYIYSIIKVNNDLYFITDNDGRELWKLSGTELSRIDTNISDSTRLEASSSHVIYVKWNEANSTEELWSTHGTVQDSKPFLTPDGEQIITGTLISHGGFVYYSFGNNIYRSDGTQQGSSIIFQNSLLSAGGGEFGALYLTPVGGDLYFYLPNFTGNNVETTWKTTDTLSGLGLPIEMPIALNSKHLGVDFNGQFVYPGITLATGVELWKTNGAVDGATLIKNIAAGEASSNVANLSIAGGRVFFTADDGGGLKLWTSMGEEKNTQPVSDQVFTNVKLLIPGNTLVYIVANAIETDSGMDNTHELWVSNGTSLAKLGTMEFFYPDWEEEIPYGIAGDTLYYSNYDSLHGWELWRSNGQVSGTGFYQDINPGADDSYPRNMQSYNGKICFTAVEPSVGRELFCAIP